MSSLYVRKLRVWYHYGVVSRASPSPMEGSGPMVWCTCVTSVVAEEFNYCVMCALLTINFYTDIYHLLPLTITDSVR